MRPMATEHRAANGGKTMALETSHQTSLEPTEVLDQFLRDRPEALIASGPIGPTPPSNPVR
jgi:hypothetical protein